MSLEQPHRDWLLLPSLGVLPVPCRLQHEPDRPARFGHLAILSVAWIAAASSLVPSLAQPMLVVLADHFQVSKSHVTILPTLAMIGGGAGLVLLGPLGDVSPLDHDSLCVLTLLSVQLYQRRSLLINQCLFSAILAAAAGFSPDLAALEVFYFFLGLAAQQQRIVTTLAAGEHFSTGLSR